MPVVCLQIGQYGNQLGFKLHDLVNQHYQLSSFGDQFFRSHSKTAANVARSVLIDTESKVIDQINSATKLSGWSYDSSKIVARKSGSGNNCAFGFCIQSQALLEQVSEAIRSEVEQCDLFEGFLILMSVAGGTGSGLGAKLTEFLHDQYPTASILNQIIWPYSSGEVAVQNYNAILTLSHLYESSNAILVFANDEIHQICTRLLKKNEATFSDINEVIARQIGGILIPTEQPLHNRIHFGELLRDTACNSRYKLLKTFSIPHTCEQAKSFSTYNWGGLLKDLKQMLICNSALDVGVNWKIDPSKNPINKSLSNVLVLRGLEATTHPNPAIGFQDPHLYSSLSPEYSHPTRTDSNYFCGYEKSAFLLSNSQSCNSLLNQTVESAWKMFNARTYLQHYTKFGLEEDDFLNAFVTTEKVLKDYTDL